ncbi:hypothetical protein KPL74_12905 [Bacillus sp. NP157]|nr:hypothetical protein KPL74_12905 [Bacillus sp. NP157]
MNRRVGSISVLAMLGATSASIHGGSIGFTGSIREPTCAVDAVGCRQPTLAREQSFEVLRGVALADYAMSRDPAVRWRLRDITYQ